MFTSYPAQHPPGAPGGVSVSAALQSADTAAVPTPPVARPAPRHLVWANLSLRRHILEYLPPTKQAAALLLNKETFEIGVMVLYREWEYREKVLIQVQDRVSRRVDPSYRARSLLRVGTSSQLLQWGPPTRRCRGRHQRLRRPLEICHTGRRFLALSFDALVDDLPMSRHSQCAFCGRQRDRPLARRARQDSKTPCGSQGHLPHASDAWPGLGCDQRDEIDATQINRGHNRRDIYVGGPERFGRWSWGKRSQRRPLRRVRRGHEI